MRSPPLNLREGGPQIDEIDVLRLTGACMTRLARFGELMMNTFTAHNCILVRRTTIVQ